MVQRSAHGLSCSKQEWTSQFFSELETAKYIGLGAIDHHVETENQQKMEEEKIIRDEECKKRYHVLFSVYESSVGLRQVLLYFAGPPSHSLSSQLTLSAFSLLWVFFNVICSSQFTSFVLHFCDDNPWRPEYKILKETLKPVLLIEQRNIDFIFREGKLEKSQCNDNLSLPYDLPQSLF